MSPSGKRSCAAALGALLAAAAGMAAAEAHAAQTQGSAQARVAELEKRVHAGDSNAVRELHRLLATANGLPREESMRLRGLVREHAQDATVTLIPPDESGERITISGTVRDGNGRPVAGALVTVFQSDAKGLYSLRDAETKRMDEPNSRIFGFLRTGVDGRYEFHTVRPGGYPFPLPGRTGDQALIPAHIHFVVSAPGHPSYGCGQQTCQMVFRDDPRMTAHWQQWARTMTFPVLTLRRMATGEGQATFDVTLQK